MQRVMTAKLTRLTHKITIQLSLVAESLPLGDLAPGGQSGNFWIHPRMSLTWNIFLYTLYLTEHKWA